MDVSLFGRDLITTQEWSVDEIGSVLRLARDFKKKYRVGGIPALLEGKNFFMVFYGSSTRTRAAFEAGMALLGGHAAFIDTSTTRIGAGEAVRDVAKMYERYGHGIGIRILDEAIDYRYGVGLGTVREFARHADVPVINMACCTYHPTQGLADLMTVEEKLGGIQGKKYAVMWGYSGRFRGRCSIQEEALVMTRFGMDVVLAHPPGFELDPRIVGQAGENAADSGGGFEVTDDYESALRGAHVVFPRNWASAALMEAGASEFGEEREAALHERHRDWTLTEDMLDLVDRDGVVTHVLPVFRGEEATDEVMDGPRSVIYDQAENGLYTKMAVLALTLGEPAPL